MHSMEEEERDKIYTAYGKAVMWHNKAEFILEHFLAFELSKIRNTDQKTELANIKDSAHEFGAKMRIFKKDLLCLNSDKHLYGIYTAFGKVCDNRNYLAHALPAGAGLVHNTTKIFQPTSFVFMEWAKKNGTIVPEQPLTEVLLENMIEAVELAITLIHKYWTPEK